MLLKVPLIRASKQHYHILSLVPLNRKALRQALKHYNSNSPNIHLLVIAGSVVYLWSAVEDIASLCAHILLLPFGYKTSGYSKVDNLYLTALSVKVHKNVVRFEVPMADSLLMCVTYCIQELTNDNPALFVGEFSLLYDGLQTRKRAVLHDEV